jgi:molybdopterin-guanine dinucleotide biosynthesis protein A
MASAAILMGGAARRLGGRDKSAVVVGGLTIFERQLRALHGVTDDIMTIGGTPRRHPHCRSVADRRSGLGPLAGLEAALEQARDDRVLLLACDMPCVTTPLLAYLTGLAPGAEAIVPKTDRGYHPLCAVYDRRCLEAVRRRLDAGALALQGLLQDITVRIVEAPELTQFGPESRLFANANTPSDLDEIESFLNHEP